MIDDLQGRTQRIGIGPNRTVLAVKIEDKAPYRIGGIAAIVHELVPIGVATLGYVGAECREKIERMCGGEAVLRQHRSERQGRLGLVGFAKQRSLQEIKSGKFIALRERGMVGNVVGCAGKTVEA